jgi:FkbM family methyltransferase
MTTPQEQKMTDHTSGQSMWTNIVGRLMKFKTDHARHPLNSPFLLVSQRGHIEAEAHRLAIHRPSDPGDRVEFEIVVGVEDRDEISEAIRNGTYPPFPHFQLGFSLIRPGSRVVDLGANVGIFSVPAAALGCEVLSIDASPHNIALINESVAQNSFHKVQVVFCAVTDHVGHLDFVEKGPWGFVANDVHVEPIPTLRVPAATLESLLEDIGHKQVDLIKMDIEGSEVAAIRGMASLLQAPDGPAILYESNGHTLRFFGETPQSLKTSIERHGYSNYLVEPGILRPVRSSDFQPNCFVDYFAVKEMPAGLRGWSIGSELSEEEVIDRLLVTCASPNEHERGYAARSLETAPRHLLSDKRVSSALRHLTTDAQAYVRDAAAWATM